MFTDYDYYQNEYHGTVISSSDAYVLYAGLAADYIYTATLGRATSDNTQVQRCECVIAETLFLNNEANADRNKQKASEKVGDYSVSYVDKVLSESELQDKVSGILYRYLAMTGLLYRGVR